jgi:hypothetical protein
MSHSACFNCGRDEQQSPLISLRFRGENWFICPQCMPVLIHNPQRLVEKLPGAGDLAPAPAHKE